MYSQGEIEEAVAAGALAPEQAASFREFVARRNRTPTGDEEYVRFYRGYNDLFVFYACMFVLISVGWLGALIPIGGRGGASFGPVPQLPVMAPILVTAASWGLAEIFVRVRRAALPGILLAFTFALGAFFSLLLVMAPLMGGGDASALFGAAAAAIAAVATLGFWQRFRVTIAPSLAVALGVGAIALLLGVMFARSPSGLTVFNIIMLLIGFGVFAYALTLDFKDPWRISDRNEIALWMHGVASALVVLPAAYLLGLGDGVASVGGGIAMIILFLVLTFVGLVVNRKLYATATIAQLLVAINALTGGSMSGRAPSSSYGANPYGGSPYGASPYSSSTSDLFGGTLITMLIISLLLLLLAIFWTPLRRSTMALMPASVRARLPGDDASPLDQVRTFE